MKERFSLPKLKKASRLFVVVVVGAGTGILPVIVIGVLLACIVSRGIQDGSPGKETYLPPVDEIQRSSASRDEFIEYSAFDAEGTWLLFEKLKQLLMERPWSQVICTAVSGDTTPLRFP